MFNNGENRKQANTKFTSPTAEYDSDPEMPNVVPKKTPNSHGQNSNNSENEEDQITTKSQKVLPLMPPWISFLFQLDTTFTICYSDLLFHAVIS